MEKKEVSAQSAIGNAALGVATVAQVNILVVVAKLVAQMAHCHTCRLACLAVGERKHAQFANI